MPPGRWVFIRVDVRDEQDAEQSAEIMGEDGWELITLQDPEDDRLVMKRPRGKGAPLDLRGGGSSRTGPAKKSRHGFGTTGRIRDDHKARPGDWFDW